MRVSEIYKSIQGEGPNVGKPTVFVRFGGCNLRCPLWPCDTPYAVDPKVYRHEWMKMSPTELVDAIKPFATYPHFNICLTGGEPILQNKDEFRAFTFLAAMQEWDLEMFSNGTLPYAGVIDKITTIVMDWKLPGSGEDYTNPTRIINLQALTARDAVKFTIANEADYEFAKGMYLKHIAGSSAKVYAGVVWGQLENETLVKWILDDNLPWLYTMQIHNHIFDRKKRGI